MGEGAAVVAEGSRRSLWAWGLEQDEPTEADRQQLAASLSERAGKPITPRPLPLVSDIELRRPRIPVPAALGTCCTTDTWERAFHAYGSHLTDRTHAFNLHYPNPPDVVAHPANDAELEAVVDWCGSEGHVMVPFGGGSSVVWGVNPPEADAVVTVALDRLDRVLEMDETSRAARIQAGVLGPHLEDQLRPAGYTLRHFPQSFGFSSLGGWIATRSGGHYATNHTHIDDFVESVRMLTPTGVVGIAPPARLGSGAIARPHGDRQRGHPRDHQRGVDAHPAATHLPRYRRCHLRYLGTGHGRRPPRGPG